MEQSVYLGIKWIVKHMDRHAETQFLNSASLTLKVLFCTGLSGVCYGCHSYCRTIFMHTCCGADKCLKSSRNSGLVCKYHQIKACLHSVTHPNSLPSPSSLDLNNNQANILITLTTQQDEFPTVGLTNMLQNQLTETGAAFGLEVLQITRSGEC